VNPTRLMLAGLVTAMTVGFVAPGCGGVCDKLATYELECGDLQGSAVTKTMLADKCNEMVSAKVDDERFNEQKSCAEGAADCAAYASCLVDKKVARRVKKLEAAAGEKKFSKALIQCEISEDLLEKSAAFKKACVDTASKAIEHYGKNNKTTRLSMTCRAKWVTAEDGLKKKCDEVSIAKINDTIKNGNAKDAMYECGLNKDKFAANAALKTTCVKAASTALTEYAKKGEDFRIQSLCKESWVKAQPDLVKACGAAFEGLLNAAIKDNKYYRLKSSCEGDYAKKNDGAKAVCKKVLASAQKALAKTVTDYRDGKLTDKKLYTTCSNYKTVSEAISADDKKKAEAACKEAEVGKYIAEAKAKLAEEMKKPPEQMKVPYHCESALNKVKSLVPSDWQKTARADVLKVCYVDFGTKYLAAVVPKMRFCKYGVKKVLKAVVAEKLKSPELDKLVAEAAGKCK